MKRSKTEHIKDILQKQRIDDELVDLKMAEFTIVKSWADIMGSVIASYTQDVSIKNGVLYLKLSSPLLKNEIIMMREQVISHVNYRAGGELINKIVFL
ncbi:MAG: DUF721 domain-containing protein [Mangrovibacterium sp.]